MTSLDLIDHFHAFLQAENIAPNQTLLIMVSGGMDSCVLLDTAVSAHPQENIHVFHLNHNARKTSDEDALFVQKMCSDKKVFLQTETLPTPKESNQEACWRAERQKRAEQYAQKINAVRILTAHHATDLVETMLFHLVKGCGIEGLAAFDISTKPFWDLPKSTLLDYAQRKALSWREDPTNTDTVYHRNLIRHEVLPALRKITPNLEQVFVQERTIFSETSTYLQTSIQSLLKQHTQGMALKSFQNLAPVIQKYLLRELSGTTPSSRDIDDCLRWLLKNPKGGTQKELGKTLLKLETNTLLW